MKHLEITFLILQMANEVNDVHLADFVETEFLTEQVK